MKKAILIIVLTCSIFNPIHILADNNETQSQEQLQTNNQDPQINEEQELIQFIIPETPHQQPHRTKRIDSIIENFGKELLMTTGVAFIWIGILITRHYNNY